MAVLRNTTTMKKKPHKFGQYTALPIKSGLSSDSFLVLIQNKIVNKKNYHYRYFYKRARQDCWVSMFLWHNEEEIVIQLFNRKQNTLLE